MRPNSARPAAVQAPISPGRVSRGASPPCLGFGQGPAGGGLLPALLRGSLETEAALLQPVRPNSARPAAVRAPISPGRVSRGASPPCLGFGQGPAGGGLLPALLRGSLETEAALFQPVRPNSARPAAVQAPISPGRVSRGASPPCLGFGQGPAGGGLLPALLRGSLETEAALFQPVRPNSARPAAVQAPISPGRVSRGASPPCLGFGQGPAGGGLLPALLRGSLETEAALLQPVRPNSARPAAVRAPISPGRVSRGASPPCHGFAQGPAGGGLLPPLLRGSLETEAALFQPVRPNSARPAAVQAPISPGRVSRGASPPCLGFGQGPAGGGLLPGRVSRGASPPCLGFGQGPAGGGLLPPLLRGSLETEAALFQPVRPNSARPAAVQAPISPGRVSRGASPPCLGFGQGPAGGGLLPALLRGSLETEAALLQPVRPNSARPAAVRAPISPGRVSRGASPPCHGFAQGPAGGGLLPPLLRGSLETEAALFQPVRPNSARPAAVQAPISPGRVSRGASPPCLGFGQGLGRLGSLPLGQNPNPRSPNPKP